MADTETTETHEPAEATQPDTSTPTPEQPESGDQGKGSKEAVLADLAAERDARQQLQREFAGLRDGMAAALGLKSSDDDLTPEQLTQQLTTAQADAAQARLELSVFRSAPDGVDAQALLDSRSFLQSVQNVDATDAAAVTAAVTAFIDANPRFITTTPRSPGHRDAATPGSAPTSGRSMDNLLRGN